MFIYKRCNCSLPVSLNNSSTIDSPLPDLLKLLSVPARLTILFLLEKKPHCVCDIEKHTSLSQSLISHHLSDLTTAGLIAAYKTGKFIDYTVTDKGQMVVTKLKELSL